MIIKDKTFKYNYCTFHQAALTFQRALSAGGRPKQQILGLGPRGWWVLCTNQRSQVGNIPPGEPHLRDKRHLQVIKIWQLKSLWKYLKWTVFLHLVNLCFTLLQCTGLHWFLSCRLQRNFHCMIFQCAILFKQLFFFSVSQIISVLKISNWALRQLFSMFLIYAQLFFGELHSVSSWMVMFTCVYFFFQGLLVEWKMSFANCCFKHWTESEYYIL